MQKLSVIGVMSGSSMDGVDLACCEFDFNNQLWQYKIIASQTIPYNEVWRQRLALLYQQKAEIYPKTNAFYGKYLGQLLNQFIAQNNLQVDLIASHGHTIFHQPQNGFTAQIGDGAAINAITNIPVVSDFRTSDIALGGQGAPLVPVGDKLLFADFDACLNLGGIANISFTNSDTIKAFDICPCNIVLNRIARWLNQPFDNEGRIAASADLDQPLLDELNALSFYQIDSAKSLGREWINENFWPIVKRYVDISEAEKMATLVQHISTQIANVINNQNAKKVLVTGGGAFNTFLLNQIKTKTNAEIITPTNEIINYKEALIFAFLGVLRIQNLTNTFSSVTGSKHDAIGGALYGNFSKLLTKN